MRTGSVEMLKIMFKVQPDRKDTCLASTDVVDHTPLHKAVLFDRADATEYLLDQVSSKVQSTEIVSNSSQSPGTG